MLLVHYFILKMDLKFVVLYIAVGVYRLKMQTGTISFCDRISLNIKSDVTKKWILSKLESTYNERVVQRHFDSFREDVSMKKIRDNPHLVCLKSNGNPYYMFLTRLDEVNTCVMIDKKIQHGYFLPRMIVVRMGFDNDLFEDTLMDGEMVRIENGKWVFLLNDIIANSGNHLINTNLIKRINILHDILSNKFTPRDDIFSFQVKKFVKCTEVRELVYEFMKTLPYSNRGIYFRPMFLKFRNILLNFNNVVLKSTVRVKYGSENRFLVAENVTKKMRINKTAEPDIYMLYDDLTGNSEGVALVNSLCLSQYLRKLFESTRLHESLTVMCTYNTRFNKWEPVCEKRAL